MANPSSNFRATQWDPVLILSQIVCLQAIWYISISVIVYVLFTFSGADITLDAILNYREIRFDNAQGMLLGLAWLLNSVVGVGLLLKIVARARLVLDFSLTLLLYHVVMTTLYSDHLPTSFLWWALNGTTAGIMVFGGEYVCMQLEMEPILIGGGGGSSQASGSADVRNNARNNARRESVNTTNANSNINNNNNNEAGGSGSNNDSLSMQGAALSGTHYDEPYHGYGDESAGLLMDTLDSNKINADTSSAERGIPQKSRPNGDANVVRGGFAPGIRSSVLGDLTRGRQRTSDGYNKVSATDADSR